MNTEDNMEDLLLIDNQDPRIPNATKKETRTIRMSKPPWTWEDHDLTRQRLWDLDNMQDFTWKAIQKMDHRNNNSDNGDNRHAEVKVLWRDGRAAWTRLEALRMQVPNILIKYALEKQIHPLKEWTWILGQTINVDLLSTMRTALKP